MIRDLARDWNHWRSGARDATPLWVICIHGFLIGFIGLGVPALLLVLSS